MKTEHRGQKISRILVTVELRSQVRPGGVCRTRMAIGIQDRVWAGDLPGPTVTALLLVPRTTFPPNTGHRFLYLPYLRVAVFTDDPRLRESLVPEVQFANSVRSEDRSTRSATLQA